MRRFASSAACAALAALVACGSPSGGGGGKELSVGVLLPMSGGQATYGEESWNGILIAQDEIRRADPSFAFSLERADEQSSKEQAGPQVKKLIENHGAHLVVGSVASGITMGAAVVCKEAGVPLLTPASTNDTLTDDVKQYGESVFRVCYKDSFQGTMLARFATTTLRAKRAVTLVDKAQPYSVGLGAQFDREFGRLGGAVEGENFTSADKDFTTLVQKVADRKPDVIMMSGYYEQGGTMLRQARDAWRGIPVIGGDGLDSPKLLELAGELTTKVYFTTHFAADDKGDERVQAFVAKYRDRFQGKMPGAMAALGYDALHAVYETARRARTASPGDPYAPASLKAALKGLEFTGVTGRIRIGEDRSARKPIVIVEAGAGGFKFLEKIQPE
jgi:branched-chain amino acid transport system substrate-binding protein